MSDYTPKTENIRLGYSYRPNLPEGQRHHLGLLAEFDRWLAAHDAEERTEWEAEQDTEEPEWEYGYTSKWGTLAAASQADAETRAADYVRGITEARESGDLKHHGKLVKRIAASKAGPWMPVEQENE